LDEIGEMPLHTQVKLLRVIQEQEFERVGGEKTIRVDVRVIAATNRDLKKMVDSGDFREDLYFRLNVFPVYVPPLRERVDEIPLLVEFFMKKYAEKTGKYIKGFTSDFVKKLQHYSFPGNVRELEILLSAALSVARGEMLDSSLLPEFRVTKETEYDIKTMKSSLFLRLLLKRNTIRQRLLRYWESQEGPFTTR